AVDNYPGSVHIIQSPGATASNTLSLHDALPISGREMLERELKRLGLHTADLGPMARKFHAESVDDLYIQVALGDVGPNQIGRALDRKSTRLNSSHVKISYAVFCLKKKITPRITS